MRAGKYPVLYSVLCTFTFLANVQSKFTILDLHRSANHLSVGPPASNHGLSRVFRGRDRPVPNSPRVSNVSKGGIRFSQYTVFSYSPYSP